MAIQGYCVKCKAKVNLSNPVVEITKRGGYMAKGKCDKSGNTVCAILSETNAKKAIASGEAKKGF